MSSTKSFPLATIIVNIFDLCLPPLVAQSCPTFCNPMECSLPDILVHEDSPGKNNGLGCHALLQGIFPTQESNQGLLYYRWILYQLNYQGSPYNIFLYSELAMHPSLHSLFHVKYKIHNLTSKFWPVCTNHHSNFSSKEINLNHPFYNTIDSIHEYSEVTISYPP